MTEVAVVILNYNGRNFLQQFLPSVIRCSKSAKIIVADNASTDDSIALLESEFSNQIEIIKIDSNRGYCGGYNYALSKIEATYFVLLNSDVEVTPGWIDPILSLFKNDSTIAAAQPKILSWHEKEKFEYAGAAGGYIDLLGYPFCRGRIFDFTETDTGQYNDTRAVFWATGACLFVRADRFKTTGGFDEDFFAHMEEIDLCWRFNRAGLSVFYCHESKVYHVGGGTLSASNPRKTYYNFRNGLSLLTKHLPMNKLMWKLPFRIVLDWVAAMLFLIKSKPADAGAVLTAHFDYFKNLKNDLTKRKLIERLLPNSKVHHVFKGILPVQYFIKSRKNFSELPFKNPK